MSLSVVEIAAWIIIGRTCLEWAGFHPWKKREIRKLSRQVEVEQAAIRAEYNDLKTSPGRQNDLLARYPHYLVSGPNPRFLGPALDEQKRRDERWPSKPFVGTKGVLKSLMILGVLLLVAWSVYLVIFTGTPIPRLPFTVPGASALAFGDLWVAFASTRSWQGKNKLAKFAVVLIVISTISAFAGLWAVFVGFDESLIGICGGTTICLLMLGIWILLPPSNYKQFRT